MIGCAARLHPGLDFRMGDRRDLQRFSGQALRDTLLNDADFLR